MAKLKTLNELVQEKRIIFIIIFMLIAVVLIGKSLYETYNTMEAEHKKKVQINQEKKIDIKDRSIFDLDQTTAIKNAIEGIKDEVKEELGKSKQEYQTLNQQIEENQKIIKEQQSEIIALKEINLKEERVADKKVNGEIEELKESLLEHKKELDKMKKMQQVSEKMNLNNEVELPDLKGPLADVITKPKETDTDAVNVEKFPIPEIKQNDFFKFTNQNNIDEKIDETVTSDNNKKEETKSMDLMMGLVDALMVTGVDAPTNVGTKNSDAKDPLPVLLSVSGEALIANSYMQDYKDCLILATATGNATTERAYLRLSKLSCVSSNGTKRIEADVEGWVYGEDNKVGVSGFLVTKSGTLILKSLMAGILQGIADSAKNSDNYFETTTANGRTFSSNAADGFGSGVGSAFKTLADFYIEMAKDLYPVIEVKGGRSVQLLMKGAKELKEVPYNKLFVNSDYELALDKNVSIEY
ncbi:TrbI/VirB10 family protein [Aliarcobacter butzleri]